MNKLEIIRAEHLGFCFGVRDAIALALEHAKRQPLTILGDLVHNDSVVSDLRERGVQIEHRIDLIRTKTVLITAHGTSEKTLTQLRTSGLQFLEATCPLVHFAHRALRLLVREGYHPVVIGMRDHVEVRGMTEDLNTYDVVLTEADVLALEARRRFGVVAQTTQPIDKVQRLLGLLRETFPKSEVRFTDTVCQPTKQRQVAAIDSANRSDLVIVIGGPQSNNTRELVETCRRHCTRVFHIQTSADLRPEWFSGTRRIGLTAGTSTPDALVRDVELWLQNLSDSICAQGKVFGSCAQPKKAIATINGERSFGRMADRELLEA